VRAACGASGLRRGGNRIRDNRSAKAIGRQPFNIINSTIDLRRRYFQGKLGRADKSPDLRRAAEFTREMNSFSLAG
jgi:hypothetical protein